MAGGSHEREHASDEQCDHCGRWYQGGMPIQMHQAACDGDEDDSSGQDLDDVTDGTDAELDDSYRSRPSDQDQGSQVDTEASQRRSQPSSEQPSPDQGKDPAKASPGSQGQDTACLDCGASTQSEGFEDVREHDQVRTANGIIDTSEIDYICWNCQEVFVDK